MVEALRRGGQVQAVSRRPPPLPPAPQAPKEGARRRQAPASGVGAETRGPGADPSGQHHQCRDKDECTEGSVIPSVSGFACIPFLAALRDL